MGDVYFLLQAQLLACSTPFPLVYGCYTFEFICLCLPDADDFLLGPIFELLRVFVNSSLILAFITLFLI